MQPPRASEPLIRAESLAKRYPSGDGQLTVFENLSFSVFRGERLALVGESGAGKSTLLHLIGGLDHPSNGQILFDGQVLPIGREAALARYRNESVGFVWQNPQLLPEFSALENVMMPLLIRGESPASARVSAAECLGSVGLAARAAHRAGELSGGERQRVVLARALITKPALLLADEPTGNLDGKTGETVFALIESIHKEFGLTSVFVTHNLAFAARCDRALQLEAGELVPASLKD